MCERKKNGRIKGLISNVWLILIIQFNLSLSLRIVNQVVAEKSLKKERTKNGQINAMTDKQYLANSLIHSTTCMRFQTMCDQQMLRSACAYAQSDQSICLSLE